jgi:mono/diheme cytochrome c family protein
MSRTARIALAALGVIVIAVAGGAAWLSLALPRSRPAVDTAVEITPARIARGRYLAEHVILCTECHSDRDWGRYGAPARAPLGAGRSTCLAAGSDMAGLDASFPGRLCFPNITPDRDTGTGAWTDGELLRALREGVDRHGEALFPTMPYFIFSAMADEDARSIVAWLRSLPAVSHAQPAKQLDFPVNLFIRLGPKPLRAPVPAVDPHDPVRYGEYLATIGRCIFCHTPRQGRAMQPVAGKLLAGGVEFRGPFGVLRSSNLTPDASGLGAMTREEFIALFRRNGAAREVAPADNTLMAWASYAGMTDEDLGAIHAYLQTVPPVPAPTG